MIGSERFDWLGVRDDRSSRYLERVRRASEGPGPDVGPRRGRSG